MTLGRAYHREMNSPVHDAIAALQQSMSAFQTALLQNSLLSSSAVLRTIRASSALEDAQLAWRGFLNLPGSPSGGSSSRSSSGGSTGSASLSASLSGTQGSSTAAPNETGAQETSAATAPMPMPMPVRKAARPALKAGRFYTHAQLWGA